MEDIGAVVADLARRFISRSDVLAVQHADGAYHPERRKIAGSDLRRHVLGEVSIGHYLVNPDGLCKLWALDLDLAKKGELDGQPIEPRAIWAGPETPEKERLRRELFVLGVGMACRIRRVSNYPIALADSGGKGLHIYGFTGMIEAARARQIPLQIMDRMGVWESLRGDTFFRHRWEFKNIEMEVFPKQNAVREGDGLGNLMRLPLGRNARTKRASYFLRPDEWAPLNPLEALQDGSVTPEWMKEPAR